jgi:hypothetical protein
MPAFTRLSSLRCGRCFFWDFKASALLSGLRGFLFEGVLDELVDSAQKNPTGEAQDLPNKMYEFDQIYLLFF